MPEIHTTYRKAFKDLVTKRASLYDLDPESLARSYDKKEDITLRQIISTLQNEKTHLFYWRDKSVKMYDIHFFQKTLKYFGRKRFIDFVSPIAFEFLYKGNHISKMRSAIRVRPIAMRACLEYMLEKCPEERKLFCLEIMDSSLSLYNKCQIISHHIPAFRPHWFDDRPKWFDDNIHLTYEGLKIKTSLENDAAE